MSESLTPIHPLVTAADCADKETNACILPGWITRTRAALRNDRQEVRAGFDLTIEAKSLRTGEWQPIMLVGNGTQFTSGADRDDVLAQLRR